MRFYTAGAEKVRISSDGYVGIGENSPANLLHVKVSDTGVTPHSSAQIVLERAGTNYLQFLTTNTGTSGILFGDGDDADVAQIKYDHNVPAMQFITETVERARIDSSGRFGLGTSSPDTLLHLNASSGSTLQRFQTSSYSSYIAQIQSNDNVSNGSIAGDLALRGQSGISMSANNGTATHFRIASDGDVTISPSGDPRLILTGSGHPQLTLTTTSGSDHCGINFGDSDDINAGMIQYTNSSDYMVFHTGGTERMRIHNSLYTSFGTTSATPTNGGVSIEGQVGHIQLSRANTNGEVMIRFMRDSAQRGSISVSTSTTYNTTSDYRLKENITNLIDAITRIKKITPRRFNFIEDENKQIIDGFIAHEVSEAVPESVTGEKDEVYLEDCSQSGKKKGDPKYQEVDYSKHVPLLTAALQEAIAKIETLETKVAALEG